MSNRKRTRKHESYISPALKSALKREALEHTAHEMTAPHGCDNDHAPLTLFWSGVPVIRSFEAAEKDLSASYS
jgi:hypothetical protein